MKFRQVSYNYSIFVSRKTVSLQQIFCIKSDQIHTNRAFVMPRW